MYALEQIDQNFQIPDACARPDVQAYSVLQPPFALHGLTPPRGPGDIFRRLPDGVAAACNEGVFALRGHCAGGRVRFCTDSPYLGLQATLGEVGKMSHFALTGSAGFDLYEGQRHVCAFQPRFHIDHSLFGQTALAGEGLREYTLYFPLYSEVKEVHLLLDKGARLAPAAPYDRPPVVFYGSSITQGGCASRPGTAYPAVACRRLGLDHINLGFSGSARGEQAMARYLAGLEMCAFVLDYDHNAPTCQHLADTHYPLYRAVRQSHPHIPILILTRPCDAAPDQQDRHRVVLETAERAKAEGDEQVYLIDMKARLRDKGVTEECSVDGSHPNDLGFYCMAEALAPVLQAALDCGLRLQIEKGCILSKRFC